MRAFISDYETEGIVDFSDEKHMKVFFSGCDFKCPYCNTPELLETKFDHEMYLREIKKEMKNQKGNIKGLFITGGEPCFQKSALLDLFRKAKELGLKTAIDTNGSKPNVIESLLKNELLDTIIIDLKSPFNETFDKVTKSATFFKSSNEIIKDAKETIQILKAHDDKIEIIFQTLIVPGLIFRKEDLLELAKEIENISAVWELKAYRPSIVADKKMQGVESPTKNFLENLRDYLQKEILTLNVRVN